MNRERNRPRGRSVPRGKSKRKRQEGLSLRKKEGYVFRGKGGRKKMVTRFLFTMRAGHTVRERGPSLLRLGKDNERGRERVHHLLQQKGSYRLRRGGE